MRRRCPILVLGWIAFLAGSVCAEEAAVEKTPELRGVLAEGKDKRFGLFIPGSGQTGWATLGQSVGGWKLKEYRAADDVLVLAKGDREEILRLSENKVGAYHAGSLADAKALLGAMKFDQRIRQVGWMRHMSKQMLTNAGLLNPSAEQLAEFEKEITRLVDFEKMQTLMAVAMSEVYTQDELRAQTVFYASDAGQAALDQQMRGSRALDEKELAEFHATPVGRSVKAKEAQSKAQIEKAMTPWMKETTAAIEKAAITFAKDRAAPESGAKP